MFIVYERAPPKDFAPLGAKPGSLAFVDARKAIALLRSFGVKKGLPGYKHFAPPGRSKLVDVLSLTTDY